MALTHHLWVSQFDVTLHYVCDVSDGFIVQVRFELVALGAVDQVLDHARDHLLILPLRQRLHCRHHQIELLLQVVEAYQSINLVPVLDLDIHEGGLDELAVDFFIVKDVEQPLKHY